MTTKSSTSVCRLGSLMVDCSVVTLVMLIDCVGMVVFTSELFRSVLSYGTPIRSSLSWSLTIPFGYGSSFFLNERICYCCWGCCYGWGLEASELSGFDSEVWTSFDCSSLARAPCMSTSWVYCVPVVGETFSFFWESCERFMSRGRELLMIMDCSSSSYKSETYLMLSSILLKFLSSPW